MKYKVGDKVRVRKDLEVGEIYGDNPFVAEMEEFKGKILEIEGPFNDRAYYVADEAADAWGWTDEMLEPVEKTLLTLEANDIVIDQFKNKQKILAVLYQDEERALYCIAELNSSTNEAFFHTRLVTDKWLEENRYVPFSEKKEIVLELTLDEVAEKYGADKVKIVKKKD